jgi:hypothetical protein
MATVYTVAPNPDHLLPDLQIATVIDMGYGGNDLFGDDCENIADQVRLMCNYINNSGRRQPYNPYISGNDRLLVITHDGNLFLSSPAGVNSYLRTCGQHGIAELEDIDHPDDDDDYDPDY